MFFKELKQFSLPELEKKVLEFWKTNKIFEKSLDLWKPKRKTLSRKNLFVFYEGPPGANGAPGIHHVLPRIFKDIVLRYKTMQGFYVPRKSGWDTHGLPVELSAEKELGLRSKRDIEAYGVAAFNKKCREVVWKYKKEWEDLTERIGFWLDLEHPYNTYDNAYIETLWWVIAQFAKKKLLYKGHKVVPWCTRCGTSLSSHELGQPDAYREVVDETAYVKFKVKPGQKIGNFVASQHTYILSWTTTPWTLPGNVALAVGPDISYMSVTVKAASGQSMVKPGETYIFAATEEADKKIFGALAVHPKGNNAVAGIVSPGSRIELEHIQDFKGKKLVGVGYEPLFDVPSLQNENSHRVYPAQFVSTEEGTGVVHVAPMYGEDDYQLGLRYRLPQRHTVTEEGFFTDDVPEVGGCKAKSEETQKKILEYLKKNDALFKVESYIHEYPHCWRCGTSLLYYARDSWFVAVSRVRERLIANNKKINWIPPHLKEGRFGEWLREVKDWNFSRERYWGTPLPVWECRSCGSREVVGSFEDLARKSVKQNTFFFLRHGEATNNIQNICGPSVDTKAYTSRLTPRGIKEVERTAQLLRGEKIDLIISSPLERAKETARIVHEATKAPMEYINELIDVDPGIFAGRLVSEYYEYFRSKREMFTTPLPEGESRNNAKRRMWKVFKGINGRWHGKKILIVSHGDPLWMLAGALGGLTDKEILKSPYPKPGKLFQVDWRPLPLDEDGNLDVHRPYVDDVFLQCPKCGKEMRRVKEVVDVWFDSGAMPFAQYHYPFENKTLIDKRIMYHADYISEAVDQTRGWFYTLLAVATLLQYESPYKNVISLGFINDKMGRKMSKSKGNIVDPWEIAEKFGIDAVRWYFYTAAPPGEPKNFDENELVKSLRRFHMIFYNSLMFLGLYASKQRAGRKNSSTHILDRWITARLHETITAVTKELDEYHVREAALAVETFTGDLSRWYIRRSRRRFQKPSSEQDYGSAYGTLRAALKGLSLLSAPFTPFLSEAFYKSEILKHGEGVLSVHLETWPKADKGCIDKKLLEGMEEVRRLASEALAKRAELGIKVRQPLRALAVKEKKSMLSSELLEVLKDEVNVKEIVFDDKLEEPLMFDVTITRELLEEGILRELARGIQDLRQKAGLKPNDKAAVFVEAGEKIRNVLKKSGELVKKEVNAARLELKRSEKFDAESMSTLEGEQLWVAVRKLH